MTEEQRNRRIAAELEYFRSLARSRDLRIKQIKSKFSYRVTAPLRLIERTIDSFRKRTFSKNLQKLVGALSNDSHGPSISSQYKIDDAAYAKWIKRFDTLGDADVAAIRADITSFARLPLVSIIVMPGSSGAGLTDSLRSLIDQIYGNLEILASTKAADNQRDVAPRPEDERIQYVAVINGEPVSETFNRLLALCTGDLIISIDYGDCLANTATYLAVRELLRRTNLDVIYVDDDEMSPAGQRRNPFFKPDWNLELARHLNYASVGVFYSRSRLRAIDGARPRPDWRWDLLLRACAGLDDARIGHLPFVLCHQGPEVNSRRANELAARNPDALTMAGYSPASPAHATAEHRLAHWPHVTMIVATRDKSLLLRRCLAGLLHRTAYSAFDIIVADNQSTQAQTQEYFKQLRSDTRIEIVPYDQPFNYSAINNVAVARARGEIIALINNDVDVIEADWLNQLVAYAREDDIGAVGAKLLYPSDTVQHAGVVVGYGGATDHIFRGLAYDDPGPWQLASVPQEFSALTGACLVMRRRVYLDVGGMDESMAVVFGDVDLCLKLREAGYRNIWNPRAVLYHIESATRGEPQPEDRKDLERFRGKWRHVIAHDPYYNPNLTLSAMDRNLAATPRVTPPWRRGLD